MGVRLHLDAASPSSDENARLRPLNDLTLKPGSGPVKIQLEPFGVEFWSLEETRQAATRLNFYRLPPRPMVCATARRPFLYPETRPSTALHGRGGWNQPTVSVLDVKVRAVHPIPSPSQPTGTTPGAISTRRRRPVGPGPGPVGIVSISKVSKPAVGFMIDDGWKVIPETLVRLLV